MAAGGARHGDRIPDSGFEDNISGLRRDFGGSTAHDTGQGLDAIVIADDHVFCRKLTLYVIQSLELLTLLRVTDNKVSLDHVSVKGMHRGAQQQHHIVCNVRRQVHAALAAEHELALQPERGTHLRVYTADFAEAETLRLGRGV